MQEFDRATDLIALHYVKVSELGWQRIDLTAALHKWYSNGWNRKLRLLIDCSGCSDLVQVYLFNDNNINADAVTTGEKEPNSNNNAYGRRTMNSQSSASATSSNNKNRRNLNVKSNHHHHNHYNINSNIVHHDSSSRDINANYNNNQDHNVVGPLKSDGAAALKTVGKRSNKYDKSQSQVQQKSLPNAKLRINSLKDQHSIDSDHIHLFLTSGTSVKSQNNFSVLPKNQDSESVTESEVHRPFLAVHLDPHRIKRVRRRAFDCSASIKGPCCKQRFYVSFQEIGWDDWILAPPGYYANYCRGECSGIYHTPDMFGSFHTHFIDQYRKLEKIEGLKQCCAPTRFSSMSLIYLNEDDKIIKRDLPKMVVEECGCP